MVDGKLFSLMRIRHRYDTTNYMLFLEKLAYIVQDILIGLLRLRKCSDKVHRPELKVYFSVFIT